MKYPDTTRDGILSPPESVPRYYKTMADPARISRNLGLQGHT